MPDAAALENLLRPAVPRLQNQAITTLLRQPGRYLCYRDADYGFVIMVLVWGPGDRTAIHDHGTWGVEAVLRNTLVLTNYTDCEVNPQATETMLLPAGTVIHNMPPQRDVHQIAHHAGDYAVSIHIYGKAMTANRQFVAGQGFVACCLPCKDVSQLIAQEVLREAASF